MSVFFNCNNCHPVQLVALQKYFLKELAFSVNTMQKLKLKCWEEE